MSRSAGRHATRPARGVPARRFGVVALGAVVVVATAGTAAAYWTAPGRGTGSSSTGTVTISASAASASGLYPGATVTVPVTVTNGGSRPVALTAVGAGQITAAPVASCSTFVTAVGVTPFPTVTAGTPVTVPVAVAMNTGASNSCQNATFSVPVTATGTQR